MRDQDERHFRVTLHHEAGYRFLSQAHEDGRLHGGGYPSDEPDPVGLASAPASVALLGSALGHCLSAALLEALRKARVDVSGFEAEVDTVVRPGPEGLPRIARVDVNLSPRVARPERRTQRCAEVFEKHCTVTASVKQGIQVNVQVDWQTGP